MGIGLTTGAPMGLLLLEGKGPWGFDKKELEKLGAFPNETMDHNERMPQVIRGEEAKSSKRYVYWPEWEQRALAGSAC